MALATKCPHCNTIFRVAHDQLKLRGGIVRCGACNEVFDGNAALLEPPVRPAPVAASSAFKTPAQSEPAVFAPQPSATPTFAEPAVAAQPELAQLSPILAAQPPAPEPEPPQALATAPVPSPLPEPAGFDEKMAALDTRAAEALSTEPIYTLELDTAMDAVLADEPADSGGPDDASGQDLHEEPYLLPEPASHASLAASAPPDLDLDFDLDLDGEPEAARAEPELDLDAPADQDAPAPDGHKEPVWTDEAALEDLIDVDAMSDSELEAALDAELASLALSVDAPDAPAGRIEPDLGDELRHEARHEPALTPPDAGLPAQAPPEPASPSPRRPDELDEVDEEALVHLSSAGLAEDQARRAYEHLHRNTPADQEDDSHDSHDSHDSGAGDADQEEPGFVRRDRRRRQFGKAATIGMSVGSVLLVAALATQGLTTFRNPLAAAMPPLKPALQAVCATLGCKIELPAQIDDLSIEQGELQTLSDTAFSFTTLLRNQGSTAQAWPSIELRLDDASDKAILRRVFTPRDYLGPDVALDKGFAPHTEQSVKLYFELAQLKASGYHIAVFYP